jgi:CDP-diacylglycerol--glycerol-3-phosphate 3-phosphatidyltransferase
MHRLPDWLSMLRIAAVPLLGGLAWLGAGSAWLVGLVLTLATDVADGFLARRLGCQSERGARLDSRADLLLYATLPLFAWWLFPDLLRREAAYLAVAIAAFTLPIAVGWLRFGRLTSYHTWAAKGTAVLMGIGMLTLFAGGPAWPFHLAVVALVYEAIEEIAISLVLPAWRSDVPTLRHALEAQRPARGD